MSVSRGTIAWAAAFTLGAALLAAPLAGHVDDTDAQLYQVVARHMVEDGTWLDLRYLPAVHPHFREHLPFALWPYALAVRGAGEGALAWVALAFSLGTLAVVARVGARLLGAREALVAVLVLALTESFFVHGARPRIDPPLVLLSLLAAAPFLLGRTGRSAVAFGALAGAAAALIKGPFGVLPLVAAAAAAALVVRSWRVLLAGALAAALALAPVGAFLLWDRFRGGGSWWTGYVEHQVLASALGTRTDGDTRAWFPLWTLSRRFWPGLPLCLVALAVPRVRAAPEVRRLTWTCALVVLGLCLPARKVWNHALVAYPLLALLAGAGARPLLAWLSRAQVRERRALGAVVALALLAVAGAAAGLGRRLKAPCVASAELAPALDALAPGTPVQVVSERPAWGLVASLAAERRLAPAPTPSLGAGDASGPLALVAEPLAAPAPAGWRERARARGWVLLERAPPR